MDKNMRTEWLRYPEAEAYVGRLLDKVTADMPAANELAVELLDKTGSRLLDWLDHLIVVDGDRPRGELADLGFEIEDVPAPEGDTVYYHPGAIFPRIVLGRGEHIATQSLDPGTIIAAAVQVEDAGDFLMMHGLTSHVEGSPLSPFRRATAWKQNGSKLLVVERRGHAGYLPTEMAPDYAARYLEAYEQWATRTRVYPDPQAGMEETLELARSMVSDLGTDTAAWIAFAAERAYWQRRNQAGQVQRARQDSLGMGWANHDHHTFRSSRGVFPLLIEILETFGFLPRERFYAGAEAGWGAQVMEQPVCRFAVFADVDLSPDEVDGDFAHSTLPPRDELGTVGLWCALHGEAMLEAGLHHLASRFDFEVVEEELAGWGIEMMRPFSDFPYLRQAFTRGERWPVKADRLDRLVDRGQLTNAQRTQFAEQGALGSHLENIQRAEGFKGFNQQKISNIIKRTDPRAGA
jgi:hypothetical protein